MYWKVDNKSRYVLWSYMRQYIAAGSIIVSDCVPQYQGCISLGFSAYLTVNHSTRGTGRFVNPSDPSAHTQNIEARNSYVKKRLRSLRTDRAIQQYLCEYIYRNQVLSTVSTPCEKFNKFFADVRRAYPGPGRTRLEFGPIGINTSLPEFPQDITPTAASSSTEDRHEQEQSFVISAQDLQDAGPSSASTLGYESTAK